MMRTLTCVTIVAVLAVFLVPWAGAGELSQDYLAGRWVIDSQSCNSMESEYIEFRKDGTYVSVRGSKSEIVGFWRLEDDMLELHMLTSPAFFDDIDVSLSWNAGGSYTAVQNITVSGTDAVYTRGNSSDTWGRSWARSS